MKIPVSPLSVTSLPFSSEALSSVLMEVVPTAMIFFPSAFASLRALAVSSEISKLSVCIWWSSSDSVLTGRKVPAPTWRVTSYTGIPLLLTSSRSSGVKWSPAVGAATLPSFLAYTV